MSLYRKYRPQTFTDVVGQDHVITTLERASDQQKLAHAFLFAGSRGTGKTSVARILAKVLMIRTIEDEALRRQIVQGVEDGSIVDLLEIDAASNRGIDDVRDLIEKIQFSPVVAGAKVYIIDEVHMLTKEAFNALLKTLEEPPEYAYFILATTELNKIPATIQSRCQCYPFRRVPETDIIRRLQYIADQEKIVIEREALRLIAHHAEGGMRDAISLMDQMRSLEKITLTDVQQRIGTTGQEFVEAIFEAIAGKDQKALIDNIRKVEEAGVPLDIFARQLLRTVRTSLHEAINDNKPTKGFIDMLDTLLSAIKAIRNAPVPGLVLESALISMCSPEAETVEITMQQKETEPAKPDAEATPPEPEAPKPLQSPDILSATPIEAPDVSLEGVRTAWADIVNQVTPASVKMSLKNGNVSQVDEKMITVSFASSFHRDKVAETEASRTVEEIVEKVFKKHLKLECVMESGSGERKKEEVVNVAEAAAEIF